VCHTRLQLRLGIVGVARTTSAKLRHDLLSEHFGCPGTQERPHSKVQTTLTSGRSSRWWQGFERKSPGSACTSQSLSRRRASARTRRTGTAQRTPSALVPQTQPRASRAPRSSSSAAACRRTRALCDHLCLVLVCRGRYGSGFGHSATVARPRHTYMSNRTCSRPLQLLLSPPLLRVPPFCAK
jgi:hypothetical protein